jgi:hypothetical protein
MTGDECIRVWVEQPEGKKQLRYHTRRLEDNIKIDLKKIGWEVVLWIYLAQELNQWRALVNN